MLLRLVLTLPLLLCTAHAAPPEDYTFDKAQTFLNTYCQNCHKSNVGGFQLSVVATPATLRTSPVKWNRASLRTQIGRAHV